MLTVTSNNEGERISKIMAKREARMVNLLRILVLLIVGISIYIAVKG